MGFPLGIEYPTGCSPLAKDQQKSLTEETLWNSRRPFVFHLMNKLPPQNRTKTNLSSSDLGGQYLLSLCKLSYQFIV